MGVFEPIANLSPAWVFTINIAAILVIGILINVVLCRILRRILRKSPSVDNAIAAFVVNAVKVICVVILLAVILNQFGVPISTFIAVLGAAGAAAALALRDTLANLVGGIVIVMTQPFGEGDLIEIDGSRGTVQEINLFTTTLNTLDYRTVSVPNGKISTSAVYNETARSIRGCDCTFRIPYDADIDAVKDILKNVCEADDIILKEPEPWIGVIRHDESCLIVEVKAYCLTENLLEAGDYLNKTVKTAFEISGIEVPYPQVDVKVRR